MLSCVGFSIQDDCYLPTSNARLKFINDVATSPRTEISHIFWLLGVYTQEQLLSWKQLDGFNYYMRTVFSFGFGHPGKRPDSKWSPHILEYFDGEPSFGTSLCRSTSSFQFWEQLEIKSLSFPKAIITAISTTAHYHLCRTCQPVGVTDTCAQDVNKLRFLLGAG